MVSNNSPISDGIFEARMMAQYEAVQRNRAQTDQKNPIRNIPAQQTAAIQQAAKPEASKPGAMDVAQKVLGYSLMGIGLGAGVALLPITLPLGFLGAVTGYGVAKLLNSFKEGNSKKLDADIGAAIGGSVGSLLTGGLFILGAMLIDNLDPVNRAKTNKAKDNSEVKQEKAEVKPKSDVKADSSEAKETPDPDGVKFLLDNIRKELSGNKLETDGFDKEYTIQPDNPQRAKLGIKYDNFFESFNKEIDLRVEIKDLQKNRGLAAKNNFDEGHPRLVKMDEDIKKMSVELNVLVEKTNTAYSDAVSPNTYR